MNNLWNRHVMRWIAPLTVLAIGGCPLDPKTVGNEQEGSGSGGTESGSESATETLSESTGEDPSFGSSSAESSDTEDETATTGDPLGVYCEDEEEILQFDGETPSGFRRCGDGFVHLWQEQTCLIPEAPATCESDEENTCTSSAECTDAPNGACLDVPGVIEGCGCVYGCETSADCGEGEVCACTGAVDAWPVCVPAGCRDPLACGAEDPENGVDALCGLGTKTHACGNVEVEIACLTPQSECRTTCDEEVDCYGQPQAPPCEIVGGEWACDIDLLCEDCG